MPNKYFHKIFVRKIELSICVCFAKQTKKKQKTNVNENQLPNFL